MRLMAPVIVSLVALVSLPNFANTQERQMRMERSIQSERQSPRMLNPQPIPPGKNNELNPQPIPPGKTNELNPQPIPPGKQIQHVQDGDESQHTKKRKSKNIKHEM